MNELLNYAPLVSIVFIFLLIIFVVLLPLVYFLAKFKKRGIVINENGEITKFDFMLDVEKTTGITKNIIYLESPAQIYEYLFYKLFHKIDINAIPFEFFPTTRNWFFVKKRGGEYRQIQLEQLMDGVRFKEDAIEIYKAKYTANQKSIAMNYTQQGILEKVIGVLFVVVFFIGVLVMFSTASDTSKQIVEKGAAVNIELANKIEKSLNGTYTIEFCKGMFQTFRELEKNQTTREVSIIR